MKNKSMSLRSNEAKWLIPGYKHLMGHTLDRERQRRLVSTQVEALQVPNVRTDVFVSTGEHVQRSDIASSSIRASGIAVEAPFEIKKMYYQDHCRTVLDVGREGGIHCFMAAERVGESGKIIGVDLTPEILRRSTPTKAKSVEFTTACPQSALVMSYRLNSAQCGGQ